MQFHHKREREDTRIQDTTSVRKNKADFIMSLTVKQLQVLANKSSDLTLLSGKVEVIGRVLSWRDMNNRTQIMLTDETGVMKIVEGKEMPDLEEGQYFRFLISVRLDKDEAVFYSIFSERITNFHIITNHFCGVMIQAYQNKALQL